MRIREMTPADAESWLEMRSTMFPDADRSIHKAEITEHFAGKGLIAVAYICVEHDMPVGFLEVSLRSWAEGCRASPIPYLEAGYVLPEFRRRGISRALVAAAEEWAKLRGHKEIGCDTWLDNVKSQEVILAMGFQEISRVVHYWKAL